jgi:leader peptidase (prepilin peptidase)/N-methyltransferase
VELATIALGALVLVVAAAATTVDLRRRVVPNALTTIGALLALVLGTVLDPSGELQRLIAGAGAGGFLLAAAVVNPEGMGLGDVKLAGAIGLCLGGATVVAVIAALAAGALYGLAILVTRGLRAYRAATLPFAPCLALGCVAGVTASVA